MPLSGDVLDIELVDSESADAMRAFLTQLQEEYGMEVLPSDDQDSYKTLTDELGLAHSICRVHVNRNVARIVAELAEEALRSSTPPPPGVQSDLEQVLADLEYLQQLIALRPPDGAAQLSAFLRRYQAAPPPAKSQKASLWYRLRLAILRWSNQWQRLTYDIQWNRRHAQPVYFFFFFFFLRYQCTCHTALEWHQQCRRTRHRLLDQGSLPHHAYLQAYRLRA